MWRRYCYHSRFPGENTVAQGRQGTFLRLHSKRWKPSSHPSLSDSSPIYLLYIHKSTQACSAVSYLASITRSSSCLRPVYRAGLSLEVQDQEWRPPSQNSRDGSKTGMWSESDYHSRSRAGFPRLRFRSRDSMVTVRRPQKLLRLCMETARPPVSRYQREPWTLLLLARW